MALKQSGKTTIEDVEHDEAPGPEQGPAEKKSRRTPSKPKDASQRRGASWDSLGSTPGSPGESDHVRVDRLVRLGRVKIEELCEEWDASKAGGNRQELAARLVAEFRHDPDKPNRIRQHRNVSPNAAILSTVGKTSKYSKATAKATERYKPEPTPEDLTSEEGSGSEEAEKSTNSESPMKETRAAHKRERSKAAKSDKSLAIPQGQSNTYSEPDTQWKDRYTERPRGGFEGNSPWMPNWPRRVLPTYEDVKSRMAELIDAGVYKANPPAFSSFKPLLKRYGREGWQADLESEYEKRGISRSNIRNEKLPGTDRLFQMFDYELVGASRRYSPEILRKVRDRADQLLGEFHEDDGGQEGNNDRSFRLTRKADHSPCFSDSSDLTSETSEEDDSEKGRDPIRKRDHPWWASRHPQKRRRRAESNEYSPSCFDGPLDRSEHAEGSLLTDSPDVNVTPESSQGAGDVEPGVDEGEDLHDSALTTSNLTRYRTTMSEEVSSGEEGIRKDRESTGFTATQSDCQSYLRKNERFWGTDPPRFWSAEVPINEPFVYPLGRLEKTKDGEVIKKYYTKPEWDVIEPNAPWRQMEERPAWRHAAYGLKNRPAMKGSDFENFARMRPTTKADSPSNWEDENSPKDGDDEEHEETGGAGSCQSRPSEGNGAENRQGDDKNGDRRLGGEGYGGDGNGDDQGGEDGKGGGSGSNDPAPSDGEEEDEDEDSEDEENPNEPVSENHNPGNGSVRPAGENAPVSINEENNQPQASGGVTVELDGTTSQPPEDLGPRPSPPVNSNSQARDSQGPDTHFQQPSWWEPIDPQNPLHPPPGAFRPPPDIPSTQPYQLPASVRWTGPPYPPFAFGPPPAQYQRLESPHTPGDHPPRRFASPFDPRRDYIRSPPDHFHILHNSPIRDPHTWNSFIHFREELRHEQWDGRPPLINKGKRRRSEEESSPSIEWAPDVSPSKRSRTPPELRAATAANKRARENGREAQTEGAGRLRPMPGAVGRVAIRKYPSSRSRLRGKVSSSKQTGNSNALKDLRIPGESISKSDLRASTELPQPRTGAAGGGPPNDKTSSSSSSSSISKYKPSSSENAGDDAENRPSTPTGHSGRGVLRENTGSPGPRSGLDAASQRLQSRAAGLRPTFRIPSESTPEDSPHNAENHDRENERSQIQRPRRFGQELPIPPEEEQARGEDPRQDFAESEHVTESGEQPDEAEQEYASDQESEEDPQDEFKYAVQTGRAYEMRRIVTFGQPGVQYINVQHPEYPTRGAQQPAELDRLVHGLPQRIARRDQRHARREARKARKARERAANPAKYRMERLQARAEQEQLRRVWARQQQMRQEMVRQQQEAQEQRRREVNARSDFVLYEAPEDAAEHTRAPERPPRPEEDESEDSLFVERDVEGDGAASRET